MAGLQGKPLLRELSNDVVPLVGSKWYSLGVQLLDEQDVKLLTTLESDFRGDAETCCTKMLERWLDIVASANWELLIAGLRSPGVKLHKLANELTTKLGGTLTEQMSTRYSDQSLNLLPSRSQPSSPRYNSLSPTQSPHPHFEISDEHAVPDKHSAEFGYLVSTVSEIIQNEINSRNHCQSLESVKRALCQVTVHSMSSKPLFSNEQIVQIKKSKDMFELTEQCRTHWTWSKYSLLKLVIKKSGCPTAKSELSKFQRKVHAMQRLKDLGTEWLQKTNKYPDDYERMAVIVDEDYDDITVEQFEEVEKFISKITQLPVSAMQLDRVGETNSVFLEWGIPAEAVRFVVMLAYQNKELFLQRSFLLLRIAGMDVLNLCVPPPYPKTVRTDSREKNDSIHQLKQENDKLKAELEIKEKEIDSLNEQFRAIEERRGSAMSDDMYLGVPVHDEQEVMSYSHKFKRDFESLEKDHGYDSMPFFNKDDTTDGGGDSLVSVPQPASGPSSYQMDMQKSKTVEQPTETDSTPATSSTSVKQIAAAINSRAKDEAFSTQKDTTHRTKSTSPIVPKRSSLKFSRRAPTSEYTSELQSVLRKKRWSTENVLDDTDYKMKQLAAAQKRVSWNEQHFNIEIDRDTGNHSMDSDLATKLKKQQEKLSVAKGNSSLP